MVSKEKRDRERARTNEIVEAVLQRKHMERNYDAFLYNLLNANVDREAAFALCHCYEQAVVAAATVATFMARGLDPDDYKHTPEEMKEIVEDHRKKLEEHGFDPDAIIDTEYS